MNLDDDTGNITEQQRRVEKRLVLQAQIDDLIRERREARPPACYRRATIRVTIAAVADWMAIALHAWTMRTEDMSAILGVHVTLGATLSGAAVILTVGWVMMTDRIRSETQRDTLEQAYHDLRILELRSVARRATAAVKASGDAAAEEMLEQTQRYISSRRAGDGGIVYPFLSRGS